MAAKKRWRVRDFLKDFDWAVGGFYEKRERGFENFLRGASIHFHNRLVAINRKRGGYPSRWIGKEPYYLDLLYAMLASWGMDSQKARLVDFEKFERCVTALVKRPAFGEFEGTALREIDESYRSRLNQLWLLLADECKIMAGKSILVGSSKTLHHLLPDVFVPIDRTYTLDFLESLEVTEPYRLTTRQRDYPDFETFYKAMLFFGRVAREVPNIEKYLGRGPMSGSVPKVIDNAVIVWWSS